MFCPQCRAEYREGFTECADCRIELVADLPLEQETLEYVELKTILTTGDPSTIAIAKSMLQEAGILHNVKHENLQDLLGAGRIGSGFNVIAGPAEIQVAAQDVSQASEVLEDLLEQS